MSLFRVFDHAIGTEEENVKPSFCVMTVALPHTHTQRNIFITNNLNELCIVQS